MSGTRLLIVEDHAVLSGAMADSLRSLGFEDVHVADHRDLSREAVISIAERTRPDLVLLDLFLGEGRLGLPLIEPLRQVGAQVVVLSATKDQVVLADCLGAGAVGLLDKAMRFDDLVAAIRRVAAGESLVQDQERAELIAAAEHRRREEREKLEPFGRLTPTEQEILQKLLEGRAPKQIARARSVSLATVRNQIHGILEKLEVSGERQALALAREAGWPQSQA